jgi:hypothetical protein
MGTNRPIPVKSKPTFAVVVDGSVRFGVIDFDVITPKTLFVRGFKECESSEII